MRKKILALSAVLVLLIISLCFLLSLNAPRSDFKPENYSAPFGVKNCVYDIECLKQAARNNEKALAFVEVPPEPYSEGTLSYYAAQGIQPPEQKGPVFSHTIQSCTETACVVKVKLERLPQPQELPDWAMAIIMSNPVMDCSVPVELLGEIPDNASDCSGPLVDSIGDLEEEAAKIRGEDN